MNDAETPHCCKHTVNFNFKCIIHLELLFLDFFNQLYQHLLSDYNLKQTMSQLELVELKNVNMPVFEHSAF